MSRRYQPHRAAHVAPGTYALQLNPPAIPPGKKFAYNPCKEPTKRKKRNKTPETADGNADFDTSSSKERLIEREGPDCAITRTPEDKDISICAMDFVTRAHFMEKCWLYWLRFVTASLLKMDVDMLHVNSSYVSLMLSLWVHQEVDAQRLLPLPIVEDLQDLYDYIESNSEQPFFEVYPQYAPNSIRPKTRFMLVSLGYKGSIEIKGDLLSPHQFPYSEVEFESYLLMPIVAVRAGMILHQREVFDANDTMENLIADDEDEVEVQKVDLSEGKDSTEDNGAERTKDDPSHKEGDEEQGSGDNATQNRDDSVINKDSDPPTKSMKDADRKGPCLRKGWSNTQLQAAFQAYCIFKPCLEMIVDADNHAFFDEEGEANRPTIYPGAFSLRPRR
ncbi:hypothetical protein CYLTODRAFT_456163 [Cylindrobasidium torrendii FP15055 ss-10]|uniref:Uncharacterized protein n=1 Tax=Cylindrobasidium torrendii FP15055 ss-10 TaxID=1314674 RepID=A0A0D7B4T6_9AGAR|nr:hypothetical protein CYLTODRAFT_456163 [Cylindrobasidium torrendii FP15055 ss-10]